MMMDSNSLAILRPISSGLGAAAPTVSISPAKSIYRVGDQAQFNFNAPGYAGWYVQRRAMYNGMDTGHNLDGTRGWSAYTTWVIGPDGTLTLPWPLMWGQVGDWQNEFRLVNPNINPTNQAMADGTDGGILVREIKGSPIAVSTQGDPNIPPGQDFTAEFLQTHPTETDYRDYVHLHTGIPFSSVKIPQVMYDQRIISNDQPSNRDIAAGQSVNVNTDQAWIAQYRDKLGKDYAGGVVDPMGTEVPPPASPRLRTMSNPQFKAAYDYYMSGLAPLGADGYPLQTSPVTYAPTPAQAAAGQTGGSFTPAAIGSSGVFTGQQPVSMAPVSQVAQIAPNTATGSVANSAETAFQNFTSQISSVVPSSLQQTVSVAGTSVPYWAIGAAALAAFFMFSGGRK